MRTYLISRLLLILSIFFMGNSSVLGVSPSFIDLKNFTCQEWNDLQPEEDKDNTFTKIGAWLIGKIKKDKFFSKRRAILLLIDVMKNCDSNPSSLLVTVLMGSDENFEKSQEKDIQDITKLTCQDLESENFQGEKGEWSGMSKFLLIWLDGLLAKDFGIDLMNQQHMLDATFRECQKNPSFLILPMVKEMINLR